MSNKLFIGLKKFTMPCLTLFIFYIFLVKKEKSIFTELLC